MSRVPFPHILSYPKVSNKFLLRFVQPDEIQVGHIVREPVHKQINPETNAMEQVDTCFRVTEIIEKRAARGDWGAWGLSPWYYETRGEYVGRLFASGLDADAKTPFD